MIKKLSNMKLIRTLAVLGLVASVFYIIFSQMFLEYSYGLGTFMLILAMCDVFPVTALVFLLISKNPTGSKKAFAAVMIITLFLRLIPLFSYVETTTSTAGGNLVVDHISDSYSSDENNVITSSKYGSPDSQVFIAYDENGNPYIVGEYAPTIAVDSSPSSPKNIFRYFVGDGTLWSGTIVNLASIIVLVILFILGMKRKGAVKFARKLAVGAFIGYFVIFAVSSIYLLVVYPITHTKMLCTMILGNGIGLIFFCLLALYFIRLSVRSEPTGEEKRILEERLARIEKEFSDGEITREIYELKREIALSDYDT